MKAVQKQLFTLRQSFARNESKGRNVTANIQNKITSLESYLDKLKTSERTMQGHKQKRSDHKKLTVF